MQKRQLGHSSLHVSVLTFGCWQAGGKDFKDTSDEASLAAMKAAYESGINFFDTAEGYGDGHSEEVVGRFLKEVGSGDVLVATKVGAGSLAPDLVRESCEKSLARLGVDRIDLYQIHWPAGSWGSPEIPIQETMGALLQLKEAGKIAAIGVSNFNAAQIEEALDFGRIDSLQPPYSLFFQPYETNGTMEYCRQNEIGVIPYSPLAQGLLTGKFTLENRPSDVRSHNALFKEPTYSLAIQAVEELQQIAAKYNATTAQLSLAWLIAQPGVTSPIVGSRTAEQIQETAKAADLQIEAADLSAISELAKPVLASVPDEKTNMWS